MQRIERTTLTTMVGYHYQTTARGCSWFDDL